MVHLGGTFLGHLLNDPKTELLLDMLSAEGDAEDAAGLTRPLSESYR